MIVWGRKLQSRLEIGFRSQRTLPGDQAAGTRVDDFNKSLHLMGVGKEHWKNRFLARKLLRTNINQLSRSLH